MKALVVEDDFQLASMIRETLESQFFNSTCWVAETGSVALQYLEMLDPSLVILDLGLPGEMDGVQVCQRIRQSTFNPMIMMLTGQSAGHLRLTGYKSGADDYMNKPFCFEELQVRISALCRRGERNIAKTCYLESPRLILDLQHMQVFKRMKPEVGETIKQIKLTPKEYELLKILMTYPERTWTRDELLEKVWPNEAESRVLDTYISRLRGKLDDDERDGKQSSFIVTRRGFGYVFTDKKTL